MKNKIILFLLFLISFANASESIDATFKKANDLYNKGDYEQALQSFENIANQGNESADLYFNCQLLLQIRKSSAIDLQLRKSIAFKPR